MTRTANEKASGMADMCEIELVRERRRQRERDALLLRHLPLAYGLARQYAGLYGTEEELAQVASLGLLHAVQTYEPGRGRPFDEIAQTVIIDELESHVRDTKTFLEARRRTIQRQAEAASSQREIGNAMSRQAHVQALAGSLGCELDDLVGGLLAAANRDLGMLADKPVGLDPEQAAAG